MPARRSPAPATTLLFVYGSLKSGARAHALLRTLPGARRVGSGWIAGRLFNLGDYPGAVIGGDAAHRIHGEVWRVARGRASFERLDGYEGIVARAPNRSLFVRRRARVHLRREVVRGWVYALTRVPVTAEVVESGRWSIAPHRRWR